MKKQLEKQKLTYEELQTVLLEIENIINNRPLTYLYPCDIEQCLTPNHLLFGRRLHNQSMKDRLKSNTPSITTVKTNNYNQYHKKLINIINQFWDRWRTEYLAELHQQHKLLTKPSKDTDINEGDIVLIKDDKKPRQLWTVGKVEQLIISKDNKVRGAEVRTPSSNSLKRPIRVFTRSKLYL